MTRDMKVELRLTADGREMVGTLRAAKGELEAVKKTTDDTRRSTRKSTTAWQRAGSAVKGYIASFIGIGAAVLGLRRLQADTAKLADSNTELRNRLRLVTRDHLDLERVRRRLLDVSRETRSSLAVDAAGYSRLSLAADKLALSERARLGIVERLNKQIRIGGSTTQEGRAGSIQFLQGIASNRLQGDELRSVLENLLGVQQALIIGYDALYEKGEISYRVTRENIRDLASEGKLTARSLIDALSTDEVREWTEDQWSQIGVTVAESVGRIREEWRNLVDDFERGTGVFARLAEAIQVAADVLNRGGSSDAIAERFQRELAFVAGAEGRVGMFGPALAGGAIQGRRRALQGSLERRLEERERSLLVPIPDSGQFASQETVELEERLTRLQERYQEVDASYAALFRRQSEFHLYRGRLAAADRREIELIEQELSLRERVGEPLDLSVLASREMDAETLKEYRKQLGAARGEEERIEELYRRRIELADRAAASHMEGAAALRQFAEADRAASLAQTEAGRLLAGSTTPQEALRSEAARQIGVIAASGQGTPAERADARRGIYDQYVAGLAALRAEASPAGQALGDLEDRLTALGDATDLSAAGLEREREQTRLSAEIARDFASATNEERQALLAKSLAVWDAEAALESQVDAYALVFGAQDRYVRRLEALRDLAATMRAAGDAGGAAAVAATIGRLEEDEDLRRLREAHEEQLDAIDGYQSRRERMEREHQARLIEIQGSALEAMRWSLQEWLREAESIHADAGSSIAEILGPDGALAAGLARATAETLVFGGSFRDAFGDSARRILAMLIEQLVRYGLQLLIVRALGGVLGGGGGGAGASAGVVSPTDGVTRPVGVFARGGIVDAPTFFSHGPAGARQVGVAGDAGPEAIMPLRVGPHGLGVVATGAGGMTVTITAPVTVRTSETDPERVGAGVGRGLIRALEPIMERVVDRRLGRPSF